MDDGSRGGPGGVRAVPRATLVWLERELGDWQQQGRVDAVTAARIRAMYEPVDVPGQAPSRQLSLGRLVLGLGGCFVGVGLIWLVAANLDQMSPLTRFAGIVVLWLAAVVGAELLAVRRAAGARAAGRAPDGRDGVVAAARVVAALAFGAVVFQAAQSLQVPAWSSGLLGFWAAGALVHAYLLGAMPPLVVGIVTGTGWCVWAVTERAPSVEGGALALLVAACLATAAAVAHAARTRSEFATPWRTAGALLALGGLFLAALPRFDSAPAELPQALWVAGGLVLVTVAATALLADRAGRGELGAVVTVLVVALLVVRWRPPGATAAAELSGEALLRAVVAIGVYLLAALWFASLGVLRDQPALTRLATAALVVFTVVQSFAVFEPILSGAALFLALGAVLVAAGYAVEHGRRRLVSDVQGVTA